METIKNLKVAGREANMWLDHDPEGRKVYAVTFRSRGGAVVQPSRCGYTSQKAAIAACKANLAASLDHSGIGPSNAGYNYNRGPWGQQ